MRYKTTNSRLKLLQTQCAKVHHTRVKKSLLFICAALLFTAPNQASASLEVIGGNATNASNGNDKSVSIADGSYEYVIVQGGDGGGGNKGGDATLNISSLKVDKIAYFVGGAGGYGDGGSVNVNAGSIVAEIILAVGGDGNNMLGDGGSVNVNAGSIVAEYILAIGGDGDNNGTGGDITIHASSVDTYYLGVGNGWSSNGGTTGSAHFSADTLKVKEIEIRKQDNSSTLSFNVGTLYVQPYTVLYLADTSVSDISISNLYFDISDIVNNSPVLYIGGDGEIDILASSITLGVKDGSALLERGSNITLIRDQRDSFYWNSLSGSKTVKRGAIFLYDFDIATTNSSLESNVTATLKGIRHNPDAKALSESHLGGVAFLNSADELLSDESLSNSAFAVTNQGISKYKTGSSIDTKGFSLLTGVSKDIQSSGYVGFYFQGGTGSYDVNGDSDGSGDVKYYGLGVFSKLEFGENVYADAGIKVGKIKNDFTLDDKSADIKLDDLYYGIQLGGGYKIRLFESSLLDLSGKYFYTHEDGDDVTVSGDKIKFDDIDSHKIKLGAKFSFDELASLFSPFVALMYEHEFGGDSKASTEYYDIDTPSLKGGTIGGEFGVDITPKESLYMGFSLKGFAGQRQGVNLKTEVEYKF